jgi:hypothetical protein
MVTASCCRRMRGATGPGWRSWSKRGTSSLINMLIKWADNWTWSRKTATSNVMESLICSKTFNMTCWDLKFWVPLSFCRINKSLNSRLNLDPPNADAQISFNRRLQMPRIIQYRDLEIEKPLAILRLCSIYTSPRACRLDFILPNAASKCHCTSTAIDCSHCQHEHHKPDRLWFIIIIIIIVAVGVGFRHLVAFLFSYCVRFLPPKAKRPRRFSHFGTSSHYQLLSE